MLESIDKRIIQDHGVYEIYEQNGNPLKRTFYRSDGPFAWNAGLYVLAYQTIVRKNSVFTHD